MLVYIAGMWIVILFTEMSMLKRLTAELGREDRQDRGHKARAAAAMHGGDNP